MMSGVILPQGFLPTLVTEPRDVDLPPNQFELMASECLKKEMKTMIYEMRKDLEREKRIMLDEFKKLKLEEIQQMKGIEPEERLPCFTDDQTDITSYLNEFEKLVARNNWNLELDGPERLAELLKGKALDIYTNLPNEIKHNYSSLKKELLKAYGKNPDYYKKIFRESKLESHQTYQEFAHHLKGTFQSWIDSCGVEKTFDSLVDLIVKDHFLSTCGNEVSSVINQHTCDSLDEVVRVADLYVPRQPKIAKESKTKSQKKSSHQKKSKSNSSASVRSLPIHPIAIPKLETSPKVSFSTPDLYRGVQNTRDSQHASMIKKSASEPCNMIKLLANPTLNHMKRPPVIVHNGGNAGIQKIQIGKTSLVVSESPQRIRNCREIVIRGKCENIPLRFAGMVK